MKMQKTCDKDNGRSNVKGFTLVELLIATAVMGILFLVMFQVYATIARLTVRIEQEKYLTQELVYAMHTIQNIVDTSHIDRGKYDAANLAAKQGVADTLHLTDGTYSYTLQRTCKEADACSLLLLKNTEQLLLTQYDHVYISDFHIRLLPRGNDPAIRENSSEGFRMTIDAQSKHYNGLQRQFNVRSTVQTFFSIKG